MHGATMKIANIIFLHKLWRANLGKDNALEQGFLILFVPWTALKVS
jgi:hypothetical protein